MDRHAWVKLHLSGTVKGLAFDWYSRMNIWQLNKTYKRGNLNTGSSIITLLVASTIRISTLWVLNKIAMIPHSEIFITVMMLRMVTKWGCCSIQGLFVLLVSWLSPIWNKASNLWYTYLYHSYNYVKLSPVNIQILIRCLTHIVGTKRDNKWHNSEGQCFNYWVNHWSNRSVWNILM